MNSIKKLVMALAMAGGALWLVAPASVALTACGASGVGGGVGGGGAGGGTGGGGGTAAECFSGAATTNEQFLNACVDLTVEKILKQTTWRDPGVTLPALP